MAAIGDMLEGMGPGLLSGIGKAINGPSVQPRFPEAKATPTGPTPPIGDHAAVPNSYKDGGKVRKTGLALVHKGEQVIPADKDKNMGVFDLAKQGMTGEHAKPPKVVHEVRTRRGASGGYIHEHHHTHPEHHPMEEHTSADQDGMLGHMMDHMGTPNPGEAEADAGQSGIPGDAGGGANAAQAAAIGM